MEPRARAGKNVGKANFSYAELKMLLHGHGDVEAPLPETVRVLDEILTDFMQSVAFEAARAAHYSGRQKIKYEDFEFALRRNPAFLGKVQEIFQKQKEITKARKTFTTERDDELFKEMAEEERKGEQQQQQQQHDAGGGRSGGGSGSKGGKSNGKAGGNKVDEEELGEGDDDDDAEADALGKKK
ncbi:hypothetical protein N3K66_002618 [Trichothecium roseum]|uniref:Uncharacterized protein n=1 Tax=Trichothecium roseum TaxID=47278 RepID=A0ACC0V9X1_9HYPO|nr:hypothetical protein N3K66_002618 [Trichothecium roseum]